MRYYLFDVARRIAQAVAGQRRKPRKRPSYRPMLEPLEERALLATGLYWDPGVGGGDVNSTDYTVVSNWAVQDGHGNLIAQTMNPAYPNSTAYDAIFSGNWAAANKDCSFAMSGNVTVNSIGFYVGFSHTVTLSGGTHFHCAGYFFMDCGTLDIKSSFIRAQQLDIDGTSTASEWDGGTIQDSDTSASISDLNVNTGVPLYLKYSPSGTAGAPTDNNVWIDVYGSLYMENTQAMVMAQSANGEIYIDAGGLMEFKHDTSTGLDGTGGISFSGAMNSNQYIKASGANAQLIVDGLLSKSPNVAVPLRLNSGAVAAIHVATSSGVSYGGINFSGSITATNNVSVAIVGGALYLDCDPNATGVGLGASSGLKMNLDGSAFYTVATTTFGDDYAYFWGNFTLSQGTVAIGQDYGWPVELYVSGAFTENSPGAGSNSIVMSLFGGGGSDVLKCGGDITLNGTVDFNLRGTVQQINGMCPYWVPIYTDDGNPITHTSFSPSWPNNDTTHYSADWSMAGDLKVIYNGG
jgi:hypothetical protein